MIIIELEQNGYFMGLDSLLARPRPGYPAGYTVMIML
jgi:hypothetical protein